MASLFFAMRALHTLGEVLLYVGLALALAATALYARSGLRSCGNRARRRSEPRSLKLYLFGLNREQTRSRRAAR